MEYTKDIVLNVRYGQAKKHEEERNGILHRISEKMAKHRIMTTIISMTFMLIILDIMLVASFVNVLANI